MARSIGLAAAAHLLLAGLVYGQQSGPAAGSPPRSQGVCTDSEGSAYSPGSLVPVRGQLMQCVIGPHWVPMDPSVTASQPAVLDVTGVDLDAAQEASILQTLQRVPLPKLQCDAVLNSDQDATRLLQPLANQRVLMMFWSPTCGPCKPLLSELARQAASKVPRLSFVGVVQAANPEADPPGEWRLLRVKGLMAEYQVGFPTCVHSSNQLAEAWQATGVPLTLLVSAEGVERVALGAKHGLRLLQELAAPATAPR